MAKASLENDFSFLLYRASNSQTSVYRELLKPFGITYTQYLVLMVLREQGDVSVTMLANIIGLSKATMSPLLQRMEEKKLLNREFEVGNERQKRVYLTKTGLKLSNESAKVTEEAFLTLGLSEKELNKFKKLCRKLASGS